MSFSHLYSVLYKPKTLDNHNIINVMVTNSPRLPIYWYPDVYYTLKLTNGTILLNMASCTDSNVQAILTYWNVPKWKTEPNMKMVKYKCYTNGSVISTTLGGNEHAMLGNLMSTALYATVSDTPFSAPTLPALNIPQLQPNPN